MTGPAWNKFKWQEMLRGTPKSALTDSERWVLVILATYTNKSGRGACASVATLAAACDKEERTIQRTLAKLVRSGYLTIREGGGNGSRYKGATVYDLVQYPPTYEPIVKKPRQRNRKTPETVSDATARATGHSTKGDEPLHPRATGESPNQRSNYQGARNHFDHGSTLAEAEPDPSDEETRTDWAAMKYDFNRFEDWLVDVEDFDDDLVIAAHYLWERGQRLGWPSKYHPIAIIRSATSVSQTEVDLHRGDLEDRVCDGTDADLPIRVEL